MCVSYSGSTGVSNPAWPGDCLHAYGKRRCLHYFYILISKKDNRFYYGSTSDLQKRIAEHKHGRVSSTCYRRPLELVYYESYLDKKRAQDRERSVKNSGYIRKELKMRLQ